MFRFEIARPSLGLSEPLALARTVRYPSEDLNAFANTCWKALAVVSRQVRGNLYSERGKPLDGQPLASLGTSGVDDRTAAAGLHPGPESMGTYTLDFAGLISSFHDDCLANRCYKRGGMLKHPANPCQSCGHRDDGLYYPANCVIALLPMFHFPNYRPFSWRPQP